VNGTASAVGAFARVARGVQTGYIYRYAFAMVIGVCLLLLWRLGFK
jgi:NADH-quinone oxidoreductase subunit L